MSLLSFQIISKYLESFGHSLIKNSVAFVKEKEEMKGKNLTLDKE